MTGTEHKCVEVAITGLVQGVGFRPFLYTLAHQHKLTGWAKNTSGGVLTRVSGATADIRQFVDDISQRKPPQAAIEQITSTRVRVENYDDFRLIDSEEQKLTTRIPPDSTLCQPCRIEMFDRENRRFRYPFITCSQCGPRFTILESLPFDRQTTSMSSFPLCRECELEYGAPGDRRFHAQTISCATCGPTLQLINTSGEVLAKNQQAIATLAEYLQCGKIVAVKGIGGYQLLCDASNENAVNALRDAKRRPEKPFAVMVEDIAAARLLCRASRLEEETLASRAAPIVLLNKRPDARIAANIVYDLSTLGLMLPCSPLHLLLSQAVGTPLVVTSGNISGEPMVIDDSEALKTLANTVEGLLIHNRDIHHRADDPVIRVIDNKAVLFRTGRGHAPNYLFTSLQGEHSLALGGHSKSTFALHLHRSIIHSQHIGDLESLGTINYFERELAAYKEALKFSCDEVLCDLHPDYGSTLVANRQQNKIIPIQHHKAHIMSCALEHGFQGEATCVAWDGTGLGENGENWGGEFFTLDTEARSIARFAGILPFQLPGGDRAARDPRYSALSVAYSIFGKSYADALENAGSAQCLHSLSGFERSILARELEKESGTQLCSSVGRLFDAMCSLLDLRQCVTFEAQAAMLVEAVADKDLAYAPCRIDTIDSGDMTFIDWRPAFRELIAQRAGNVCVSEIAARFHHTLVSAIEQVAGEMTPKTVILGGGVFQNDFLTGLTASRLQASGHQVLRNQQIPPNDAGLAVGQIAYSLYRMGE